MAELHVQPKKRSSILPWILGALVLLGLIWLLSRNKHDDNNNSTANNSTTTAAPVTSNSTSSNAAKSDWTDVNMNAPAVQYDEITNRDISVRGDNGYGIYGIGENVLFDKDKATIRSDAEANLKQIVGSIQKRYSGGEVKVFGFTDAQGSAGYNKELAQQRADAVKAWLQTNGIDANRISVAAIGEAQPVASNSTEEGRQQNRRVEIVARNAEGNDNAGQ